MGRKTYWAAGFIVAAALALSLWVFVQTETGGRFARFMGASRAADGFVGSSECRPCHENFYKLWAPSWHGLAMQSYKSAMAHSPVANATTDVVIGKYQYRADITSNTGFVREIGPGVKKRYPMLHTLGGKDVYYFLTPAEKGRLQVLPIAYDVRRREWFDTTLSALRHFHESPDAVLHWTERPLTFNTSCHGCHVSQISSNYDSGKDSYRTTWTEPGINCETCHGPGGEHVRVCRAAPKGQTPADIKIISTKKFTAAQMNSLCAPCHAKMIPLTGAFKPGDRYLDHYDLVCLEDRDFYPDGRDLGENYTYTLWLTSPCVKSGQLSCMHCHTSSGRYRFKGAEPNQACLPCHEERVKNAPAHTHHKADSAGNSCISCHMPMTDFARMRRSDHSMRPPTPAATIAFKSPNACNLCHTDKDAAWADRWVRQWQPKDYQAPLVQRAGLIDAARRGNWTRLPEMLAYLTQPDRDEVFTASLIRMMGNCPLTEKTPALIRALKDPSALVRAAATQALGARLPPESLPAMLEAASDDTRLVRIRAAEALSGAPAQMIGKTAWPALERAMAEFEAAMRVRPDDSASHYNLGNFYFARGEEQRAVEEYTEATRLQPDNMPALVNASLAYNQLGKNDLAEASLRKALKLDPGNSATNLNLGLLLGEQGRVEEAAGAFRQALKSDPKSAVAAYNLGVILAEGRPEESLGFLRQAAALQPDNARYAYSLAFYLRRNGRMDEAIKVLEQALAMRLASPEIYGLLGAMLMQTGQTARAVTFFRQASEDRNLTEVAREYFRQQSLSAQKALKKVPSP